MGGGDASESDIGWARRRRRRPQLGLGFCCVGEERACEKLREGKGRFEIEIGQRPTEATREEGRGRGPITRRDIFSLSLLIINYRGEYFFSILISCGRNIFSLSLFFMGSDISSDHSSPRR